MSEKRWEPPVMSTRGYTLPTLVTVWSPSKSQWGSQGRLHAVPPWLGRMGPASFEGDVGLTRLVLLRQSLPVLPDGSPVIAGS